MRANKIEGIWVLDPFDTVSLKDNAKSTRQVIWHDEDTDDVSWKDLLEQEFITDYDEVVTFTVDTFLVIDPEISSTTLTIPNSTC